MSSQANNNLPNIQPTPSGSMRTASSQSQQHQQRAPSDQQAHQQQTTSSRRQHRGRGGRPAYRGPNYRHDVSKNLPEEAANSAQIDVSPNNPDSADSSHATEAQSSGEPGGDAARSTVVHKPRGGQRMSRGGGGGSGKYRQRNQMNQLIDGMDGLDIDLVESIAPSNRPNDSGKGRHATVTRKVNLTHLLNYDRRQRGGHNHRSSADDRVNHHYHRHPQTYYRDTNNVHKFNKQQFLQANCQFVVLPFHDYTIHKIDPDWPVDWDCIEEVKFRQTGTTETTCPICLDPPISARITKCGHIYCWTCMLQFLSLCDEKSRQCPICFEPVSERDLRSVVSRLFANHAVDESITMRLMCRKKGCVDIEPYVSVDQAHESPSNGLGELYESQASLLIVDPATVIAEVAKREQDELLLKLELDRDEPEVCFVEEALVKLKQRVEKLQQLSRDPSKFVKSIQSLATEPSTSQREEKSFLFYQSADGQHIYLNPFSTKILCHQFGNLENCPTEIEAKVLQMDWISMSESWRKRFKYLEHLPLTCEFRLIEIDFETSNLVSSETFAAFANQIKIRANERAFRKTEEMKRDKIIQIEQDRRIYGIQPSLNINLDNLEQFPSVSEDVRADRIKTPSPSEIIQSEPVVDQRQNSNNGHLEELDSGVPLSFKEIQERQEAAEAAKIGTKSQATSSWSSSKPGQKSTNPQSSFAKLLVDAKSSSKQWTRSANSTATKQTAPQAGVQSIQRPSMAPGTSLDLDDDDGGEELRAPPCRFTIGDMLAAERVAKRTRKRS